MKVVGSHGFPYQSYHIKNLSPRNVSVAALTNPWCSSHLLMVFKLRGGKIWDVWTLVAWCKASKSHGFQGPQIIGMSWWENPLGCHGTLNFFCHPLIHLKNHVCVSILDTSPSFGRNCAGHGFQFQSFHVIPISYLICGP